MERQMASNPPKEKSWSRNDWERNKLSTTSSYIVPDPGGFRFQPMHSGVSEAVLASNEANTRLSDFSIFRSGATNGMQSSAARSAMGERSTWSLLGAATESTEFCNNMDTLTNHTWQKPALEPKNRSPVQEAVPYKHVSHHSGVSHHAWFWKSKAKPQNGTKPCPWTDWYRLQTSNLRCNCTDVSWHSSKHLKKCRQVIPMGPMGLRFRSHLPICIIDNQWRPFAPIRPGSLMCNAPSMATKLLIFKVPWIFSNDGIQKLVGAWATPLKNMHVNWDDNRNPTYGKIQKMATKPPTSNGMFRDKPSIIGYPPFLMATIHHQAEKLQDWNSQKTMIFGRFRMTRPWLPWMHPMRVCKDQILQSQRSLGRHWVDIKVIWDDSSQYNKYMQKKTWQPNHQPAFNPYPTFGRKGLNMSKLRREPLHGTSCTFRGELVSLVSSKTELLEKNTSLGDPQFCWSS